MPKALQLGRYHLLSRIAFGGMAEIFRAKTFDRHGRPHHVAVKRVLSHLVEDEEFLQMLVDEAKISAILRHENIARVYEFSRTGNEYFLALEYVDGKDLRTILERRRHSGQRLPPEHAAWIALGIANALHAAHQQRDGAGRPLHIVHRDVSPSNVLCSYQGEVKLCDFGIAKATLSRAQTKTGVIKGKVKYMSPEQALGRRLDGRSDLFSLGTMLYETVTLRPPFQAPSEIELIFAVREAKKVPLKQVSPDVPDELCQIVDRAMMHDRNARYPTGEAMALDLRRFLDNYRPGYRRSHFGHYLRQLFAEEIEQELRQLEAFVIDQGDAAELGVNLIADALPPDAPFTQFSPVDITRLATSNFPQIVRPPPSDLHSQETQLLDRARVGAIAPAPTPGLHDQKTALFQTASVHNEPTAIKQAPTRDGYVGDPAAAAPIESPSEARDTDLAPKIAPEELFPEDAHAEGTKPLGGTPPAEPTTSPVGRLPSIPTAPITPLQGIPEAAPEAVEDEVTPVRVKDEDLQFIENLPTRRRES